MKTENPRMGVEHALLKALTSEAARRNDNLTNVAAALGVTYRRLAQWRSGDADIGRASDRVMLACADYLGVPAVLVLMLAGRITLELLLTPSTENELQRLQREMRRLLVEPKFGGIAPTELLEAHPRVQRFVSYLAAEVSEQPTQVALAWKWLQELSDASGAVKASTSNGQRSSRLK